MNVLISIKPKYIEKILSKEKTYEFRKTIFKKKVDNILIYSNSPEKKIIGYFEVNEINKYSPENLWDKLSSYSGIEKMISLTILKIKVKDLL